jgi:hypothetical protein
VRNADVALPSRATGTAFAEWLSDDPPMKVLGLLGGMSRESTIAYYRLANEETRARLGGLHSAPLLLWSVDFAEIEELQIGGRWDEAGVRLASAAQALERAGAELLVLCTNTMHKVADAIESASCSVARRSNCSSGPRTQRRPSTRRRQSMSATRWRWHWTTDDPGARPPSQRSIADHIDGVSQRQTAKTSARVPT